MKPNRSLQLAFSETILASLVALSLLTFVFTVNLNHGYLTTHLTYVVFITLFVLTIGLNIYVKIGDPYNYTLQLVMNAKYVGKTLGKTILGTTIYPSLTVTFLSFIIQTMIYEKTPFELMKIRGVELTVLTSTLFYSALLFVLALTLRSILISLWLTSLTIFTVTFLNVKPINQIVLILDLSTTCIVVNIALVILINMAAFIYIKLVKPV